MIDCKIWHTRTRMCPVDVGTVVDVDIIVRLMANVVPWVQLSVIGHAA